MNKLYFYVIRTTSLFPFGEENLSPCHELFRHKVGGEKKTKTAGRLVAEDALTIVA